MIPMPKSIRVVALATMPARNGADRRNRSLEVCQIPQCAHLQSNKREFQQVSFDECARIHVKGGTAEVSRLSRCQKNG